LKISSDREVKIGKTTFKVTNVPDNITDEELKMFVIEKYMRAVEVNPNDIGVAK